VIKLIRSSTLCLIGLHAKQPVLGHIGQFAINHWMLYCTTVVRPKRVYVGVFPEHTVVTPKQHHGDLQKFHLVTDELKRCPQFPVNKAELVCSQVISACLKYFKTTLATSGDYAFP